MSPMHTQMESCWNTADVGEFIRTTALANDADRSIFLATHAPMNLFLTPSGSNTGLDEESLLKKIVGTKYRSLTVLVGESGSGKSHLVQWLKFRWEDEGDANDVVVLVPRVEGSLKGSLEHLRKQLGPKYGAPLENVARSTVNRQGQIRRLLDALAEYLNLDVYAHPESAPEEAVWLTQNEASSWFRSYHLPTAWTALQPIISHLSFGAVGEHPNGDVRQVADFSVLHLPSFVDAVTRSNGPDHGRDLFRQLKLEVDRSIRSFEMPEGPAGTAALRQLEDRVPISSRFIRALNSALPFAVRNVVGLAESELLAKFMDVRKLLRADGKRLVFLLEDISNLRGVDKELLEALLPTPQEQEDICALVAIVGVTRDYWEKVGSPLRVPNIVDRTDNTLCLSSYEEDKLRRQAAFLQTPEDRYAFVGRYLNGVRLGRERVTGGRIQESACRQCKRRPECHLTFDKAKVPGIDDDVGMFPFTKDSLERFWTDELHDTFGDRTLKTPRGLLNRVVVPVLLDGQALDQGTFPSMRSIDSSILEGRKTVRAELLPTIDFALSKQGGNRGESESSRRNRLELVHTYWGPNAGDDLLVAFSLLAPSVSQPQTERIQGPVRAAGTSVGPQHRAGVEIPVDDGRDIVIVNPPPVARPPRTHPEFEIAKQHLANWVGGQRLQSPSFWAKAVDLARSALEPEPNFCGAKLWEKIFTKSNVVLQGVTEGDKLTFVIPRSRVVEAGLVAIIWLNDYDNALSPGERARHVVAVAAFQQELTRLAVNHYEEVCRNLSRTLGGTREFGLVARVAVAVAGLAQRQTPLLNEMTLWHRSFAAVQPGSASTMTGERQPALQLVSSTCDAQRRGLVTGLELFLGVGAQGRWLDAFQVRSALSNWAWQEWVPPHIGSASIPHSAFRDTLLPTIKCVDALVEVGGAIGAIRSDVEEVRAVAKDIENCIGDVALEVVLDRASSAIQRIEREQPDLLTNQALATWRRTHTTEISPLLAESEDERPADIVERFLDNLASATTASEDIREAHDLLLRVPWRELYRVRRALKVIESTVNLAHAQGRAWLDAANLPERDEVERYLARIEASVASLREQGADAGVDHDDA